MNNPINGLWHLHLRNTIVAALEKTGHLKKIRRVYSAVIQPQSVRTLTVMGVQAKFWTPTKAHEMDIQYFTEQFQLETFLRALQPNDIVWDVGANVGAYAIMAA